jgi:hypothetical protein
MSTQKQNQSDRVRYLLLSLFIKMGHGIQAVFVYHHEYRHQDEVTAGCGFPRATSPTIDRTKRCLS